MSNRFKIDVGRVVVRLTEKERETLKILTAALKVSEYTDEVDAVRVYQRTDKIRNATIELFSLVIGLSLVASDLPPEVREQLGDTNLRMKFFEPVLSQAFEVGRRFKRFNPDKIRSEYGKLLMMLQDAVIDKRDVAMPTLVRPVLCVKDALDRIGAAQLLSDDRLPVATDPLPPRCSPERAAEKDKAFSAVVQQFAGSDASKAATIERCLRSIDDAKGFIAMNVEPIEQLIDWNDRWFKAGDGVQYSLKIRNGKDGAMLTHSHAEQCQYVKEALTLWRIVQRDIFDFWECVEEDMIGNQASAYRICDTGQGFHRMCSAPLTYRRMHEAISEARNVMGGWVGSTIVHLGDRDVPNALVFIDKYTIIPRLVGPIVTTIRNLQRAFDESLPEPYPGYRTLLLAGYPSSRDLIMTILCDFFKHGFDGSGDDGGSCIDGRLTSAWNWCNLLHKKPFYHAFVLTGFTGFDANY